MPAAGPHSGLQVVFTSNALPNVHRLVVRSNCSLQPSNACRAESNAAGFGIQASHELLERLDLVCMLPNLLIKRPYRKLGLNEL